MLFILKYIALLHLLNGLTSNIQEISFVQYTQAMPPVENTDKSLVSICLCYATEEEFVHSVRRKDNSEKKLKLLTVGEWHGLKSLQPTVRVVHFLRSNISVTAILKSY